MNKSNRSDGVWVKRLDGGGSVFISRTAIDYTASQFKSMNGPGGFWATWRWAEFDSNGNERDCSQKQPSDKIEGIVSAAVKMFVTEAEAEAVVGDYLEYTAASRLRLD